MRTAITFVLLVFLSLACNSGAQNHAEKEAETELAPGYIAVPDGFKAEVFAKDLGRGRHLASGPNGVIYLRLATPNKGKSIVALKDTNGDGQADMREYFEDVQGGTGIKVHQGYLYFSSDHEVFRRRFQGDEIIPSGARELILTLDRQTQHAAKPLAFDDSGNMYVTIGAPSNACQDPSRTKGVPGQDPCPLLETSGGIWKFSANTLNQTFADGIQYSTGIRHAVGIYWNPKHENLYAMQHGRDQLHEFWPDIYTLKQSAELPAEEFLRVLEGSDFGWPYCYFDHEKHVRILNPEYGGNGDSVGRCSSADYPIMGFPGHWAPNALEFYYGDQFPVSYKGGAFIAFHGSWNRAPFPQQGYRVVFVPFSGTEPISGYQSFATQFAGKRDDPQMPGEAEHRPCGLAVGADGCLYISDSVEGWVWKISHTVN